MSVQHLLLLLLGLAAMATCEGHRPSHCHHVRCARPLCANPATPPGQCCPSCAGSGCRFEGCVQVLPGRPVQWKPSGCITCTCDNNQTLCAGVGCPLTLGPDGRPFDPCPGIPKVLKPDQCCPVCDYGLRRDRCNTIQVGSRNVSVSSGDDGCLAPAPLHGCDKPGFLARRHRRVQCITVPRRRRVKLPDCGPFTKLHYRDTVCRAKLNRRFEIGCDLLVPPSP